MDFGDVLKFYVSLVVVCNPFSAIPAILGFTRGRPIDEKKQIAWVATFAIGVIFFISLWIGRPLLEFFDIRICAFQLAGGFVLFLLSLSLLNAENSPISRDPEAEAGLKNKASIAVVPLAIPIIAGPGAISTAVVFSTNFPTVGNRFLLSLCSIAVALTIGFCLHFATRLEKLLGSNGIHIMGRIGGLILAAIAVEVMSKGLIGLFPILSSVVPF